MQYLTRDEYLARTRHPLTTVKQLVATAAGTNWIDQQLKMESAIIEARLASKYCVPFTTVDDVYPSILQLWLGMLVDRAVLIRVGVAPEHADYATIIDMAKMADEQLAAAARSTDSSFGLPVKCVGGETSHTKLLYSNSTVYGSQQRTRALRDKERE